MGFISYGGVGGARSVEQLRLVSVELNMVPLRTAIHIQAPWNLLNDDGILKEKAFDPFIAKANKLLDDLLWFARALKNAK